MAENGGAPAPAMPYIKTDLVSMILLRLPPSDVNRGCRYVCREWRDLVADGHFVAAHRRLRSPMPLLFYRRDFSNGPVNPGETTKLLRVDLQAIGLAARQSRRVVRFRDVQNIYAYTDDLEELLQNRDPNAGNLGRFDGPDTDSDDDGDMGAAVALGVDETVAPGDALFEIHGSCEGILLLSRSDRLWLYACNPCTGHWASLPPIHSAGGIVAFYARASPGGGGREYRVLCQRRALMGNTYTIHVLGALGHQAATPPIGRRKSPTMPLALAWELDDVLSNGLPPSTLGPPIMVQSSLHWLPLYQSRKLCSYKMVAFDTDAEEFRWVAPPPALTDPNARIETEFHVINAIQLLEIEGMLAMAVIDDRPATAIHIWVLQDYANEAWVQKYRIDHRLNPTIAAVNLYDPLRLLAPLYVVFQEGVRYVLVPCPYSLLQCDDSGTVLQYHGLPWHWAIATGYLFEESFVRPAFLSARGNQNAPPFFVFQ